MTASSKGSSPNSNSSGRLSALNRSGWITRAVLLLAAFLVGAGLADGYARIVLGGKTLYWSDPQIPWQLNPDTFTDLDSEGVSGAADRAFSTWNQINRSAIDFQRQEDTTDSDYSRSTHLVYQDSNNSSGFFPSHSGIVAITPIIYSTSDGRMIDVDILFNGKDYNFSLQAETSKFDLQDVMTHEVGHMIGLDHSPHHGASMWPFVSPGQWLHRSLSQDDISGAIAAEKSGGITLMRGKLTDSEGVAIEGGAVAALRADDGRLAAIGISNSDGNWAIHGAPNGIYHLYSFPIEGYMDQENFTSDSQVDVDFGVAFYGGFADPYQFSLSQGETLNCGTLMVPSDGSIRDVFRHAQVFTQGETKTVTVYGNNFQAGQTTLVDFSPHLSMGASQSTNFMASASLTAQVDCPVGSYDLFLTLSNGELEVVPGAIEVVAPAPEISSLNVVQGDVSGGDEVIVSGTGFAEGAYVIVGGREASETQFLDSTRIGFLTPPGDGGMVDVLVQNPDGQEGILESGFSYSSIPQYDDLFPRAGYRGGGTLLRVIGTGFTAGMTVQIDGISRVPTIHSASLFTVTTPRSNTLGSVDVVLKSADEVISVYEDIFTYVDAPDPTIDSFTPESGKKKGGTRVNLYGDNLTAGVKVRFGVDPETAQGGNYASGIERPSLSKLTSRTPSNSIGAFGVALELPNGQGVVANSTFQFNGSTSSGGGGGCGGVATGLSPGSLSDSYGFLILVGAWFLIKRPRSKRLES